MSLKQPFGKKKLPKLDVFFAPSSLLDSGRVYLRSLSFIFVLNSW
ncbi:hypothetical protein LEP1GSC050_1046 [Leptospira broomii serovar Hurstbridge str. 5399]|uniref:Uncharacterized protein n=1 Tax=Leptospira broomii serovar Hurstbridge str. 5399 TaxID=1049789 RepID=T0FHU6_9LEPT|nr:hypothetical protein LEP1GSC050_1046 [Leptospira broomii serovar Hurstbridge str. 5399]